MFFFFQAEDGIRDRSPSRGLGDVYKRQVDRTKVLTAESIMIPALTTNLTVDGPTVALRKMSDEEVSGLVAVNRNRELLGYLSSDAAVTARRDKTPLTEVVSDMPTVSLDTLIVDIMPIIYDAQTPVAVVDDNNRVKGVIIRGGVLEALADTQGEDEHA